MDSADKNCFSFRHSDSKDKKDNKIKSDLKDNYL